MELDKRIEALTDILSVTVGCHDWELMTKKGYFANSIFDFKDLKRLCAYGEYAGWREHNQCFLCKQAGDETYYSYFLPESRLLPKEPEKKYRAFTIKEFQQKYSVGSVFQIRQKQNRFSESVVQYTGYKVYEERIYLGITDFTLDELFENFEMIEPQNDTWQPFGIIDESQE